MRASSDVSAVAGQYVSRSDSVMQGLASLAPRQRHSHYWHLLPEAREPPCVAAQVPCQACWLQSPTCRRSRTVLDCSVTDLGEVLRHVAQQLSHIERQKLASTCRALRHAPELLEEITEVTATGTMPDQAVDLAFLQLLNLQELRLVSVPSLHECQCLSSLTGLRKLVVQQMAVADLLPLRNLPALRALTLSRVDCYVNLEQLSTQLTRLKLRTTASVAAVAELTSLRTLSLCNGAHVSSVAALSELTHLILREDDLHQAWLPGARISTLNTVSLLPRLGALDLPPCLQQPTVLTTLTRLGALYLDRGNNALPAALCDLSMLPALRRLGLVDWTGECSITAAQTLTSVYLRLTDVAVSGFLPLPDLTGCPSLEHLMLRADVDSPAKLVVSEHALPGLRIRTSVLCYDDQLFFETGLEAQLNVQYVTRLPFTYALDL